MPELPSGQPPDQVPGQASPAKPTPPAAAKSVRTRDIILVGLSFVVGTLAVWFRGQGFDLGLVLLSAALFWIAVLDSGLHGTRRSGLLVFLASAVLIGIGAIVVATVALLLFRPRVPVAPVSRPLSAPISEPAPASAPNAPAKP